MMSSNRRRGGRGRGRGRSWRVRPFQESEAGPYPAVVRPIFDWTEVAEHFPQSAPLLDSSLLAQLLSKRVQEITPSLDEQALVQGFCTKVTTVIENMILTGEGEELMLDEVRAVGSLKKGTALAGNIVADVVVLLRDLPTDSLLERFAEKVSSVLSTAQAQEDNEGSSIPVKMSIVSSSAFELENSNSAVTRVYLTSTGDKVYGRHSEMIDTKPFEDALRMIRQARWWEDHTSHLKSVRGLVRILKDMRKHVPGLAHLNHWCLELICNCAVIPLVGDEPLSLVDGFKRVFQLLAAGLFLPGSIGIPDPCEDVDEGVHQTLTAQQCDELTRNSQMILQMLSFGAYREILGMDGATPAKFSEPYTFGSITISVAQPAYEKPRLEDNDENLQTQE